MRVAHAASGFVRSTLELYRLQLHLLVSWREGRRALLGRLIVSLVVGVLSFAFAAALIEDFQVRTVGAAAIAVVTIGVLNAILRPVVIALFSPFTPIAMGIAAVVMQVVVILATVQLVPGFEIDGFWPAFWVSWIYALANTAISSVVFIGDDDSFYARLVREMARRSKDAVATTEPGVVIVQVDGLSYPVLRAAVRSGRAPFLAKMARDGGWKAAEWTTRLPSQTSASQAGILHGRNDFIPAFRWYEKERGKLMVSNHPADAAEIERRASNGQGLLANGGVSINNLVSGDARVAYLTMSRILDMESNLRHSAGFYSFFVSPYVFTRSVVLTLGEAMKERWQAHRQRVLDVQPRQHRGWSYVLMRAASNVMMRDLNISLLTESMFRGVPVMYADFVDYDEIAHHAGPERFESLRSLEGIDQVLRRLWHLSLEAPRPCRFVILSDHGQSLGATFLQRFGVTLQHVIAGLMGGHVEVEVATSTSEDHGAANALMSESVNLPGTSGRVARRVLRRRLSDGGATVDAAPPERRKADAPELVVCASGNLALVYFPGLPGRASLERIETAWPGLLGGLVAHDGVGFVMARSDARGPVAIGREGSRELGTGIVEERDPLARFGDHAADDLLRLDAMEHCPDVVVNSFLDPDTDEVAAFEELIGCHGGLGGWQTRAFVIFPGEWPAPAGPIVVQPGTPASPASDLRGQVSVLGLDLGAYRIFLIAAVAGLTALLHLLLVRTRFGAQVRASVDNAVASAGLGINVNRVFGVTFALGSGLAGLGGGLGVDVLGLDPTFPFNGSEQRVCLRLRSDDSGPVSLHLVIFDE